MSTIFICMALLPVIFMLHDFEEVIFMEDWYKRKRYALNRRVPNLYPKIDKMMRDKTTASFALSVFFMFMLVSVCTFYALVSGNYIIWWGAFLIFTIHLLMHVGQSIIIRGYVPAVVTSVLCLPYSIWGYSLMSSMFTCRQTLVILAIGLPVTTAYLILAHKVGKIYNNTIRNN